MGKHGVTLYGVVVTGPTKELLKLKQDPMLTAPYIGR
ncbi:anti sigma factor C-terminal domain-containing protein [Aneurinibacillus sp. REN35]